MKGAPGWLKKEKKFIYVVGVFNHPLHARTVGWFKSEKQANEAVKNNIGDIHEFYYQHAVVEKFAPGFYPMCFNEGAMWYTWDPKKKKYIRKSRIPDVVKKLKIYNLTLK